MKMVQGLLGDYEVLFQRENQGESMRKEVDSLLRDSIATAVLQAYMTRGQNINAAQRERELIARACYQWADSMLTSRGNNGNTE